MCRIQEGQAHSSAHRSFVSCVSSTSMRRIILYFYNYKIVTLPLLSSQDDGKAVITTHFQQYNGFAFCVFCAVICTRQKICEIFANKYSAFWKPRYYGIAPRNSSGAVPLIWAPVHDKGLGNIVQLTILPNRFFWAILHGCSNKSPLPGWQVSW